MLKLAVLMTVLATVFAVPHQELEARKKQHTVTVTATVTATTTVSAYFNNLLATTYTSYGSDGCAPTGTGIPNTLATTYTAYSSPTGVPYDGKPYCEYFAVGNGQDSVEGVCRYNPGGPNYQWDGTSTPDANIISGTGCATSTFTSPSTAVGCVITAFPTATASA